MQRVAGIGGIFFKARDAERHREWYRKHLGLSIADWGGFRATCRASARALHAGTGSHGAVLHP